MRFEARLTKIFEKSTETEAMLLDLVDTVNKVTLVELKRKQQGILFSVIEIMEELKNDEINKDL